MEALALASTFATLIGFSMQLYSNCKYYIDAAKNDAPSDLRLIMIETSSLTATLTVVRDLVEVGGIESVEAQRLDRQIGKTVENCKDCIEKLATLVPKPMLRDTGTPLSKTDKAKILLNALAWGTGGKKGKCDSLLQHLRAHKATLTLSLTTELSHEVKKVGADVAEVKTTVKTMQAGLDQTQRNEIHKWLEKVNPSRNHNDAGKLHEGRTGQWLIQTDEWGRWASADPKSRCLWVHGIAGAGKTVLAYTMIQQVKLLTKDDKKKGAAYYYCYHARNKDEAVPFLEWIISQLCRASENIPGILKAMHKSGCESNIKDLLDGLEAVLQSFTVAFVVVDAIDESMPRTELVKVLSVLASEPRFSKLRLAITSREYVDIEAAFKSRFISVSMSNRGVWDDIQNYVTSTLRNEHREGWDQALKTEVADRVYQKAGGMFRYAACQLEILVDCGSIEEVRWYLNNLPATLEEMYERIVRKIDAKNHGDAARALALILGSLEHTGPILAPTLVSAVISSGGKAGAKSFFTINTLRKHCGCLIRLRGDNTVDLAHYTVSEFLRSRHVKERLPVFWLNDRNIDEIYCNTVMSVAAQFSGTPDVLRISEDGNGDPTDYRLYALRRTRLAMFWSRNTMVDNPEIRQLLIKLLNPYEPPFKGLQLLGVEGHSDASNEILFEWLPKFSKTAGPAEKAAAHLTMLVGMERPNLVNEFLALFQSNQQRASLFTTEMKVRFPVNWELYRQHGTHDAKNTGVTVLDFYKEGHQRGYDTKAKLDMLRGFFAAYIKEPTNPAPARQRASTPTQNNSTPGRNRNATSTPSSSASRETATPRRGGTQRSSSTLNSSTTRTNPLGGTASTNSSGTPRSTRRPTSSSTTTQDLRANATSSARVKPARSTGTGGTTTNGGKSSSSD